MKAIDIQSYFQSLNGGWVDSTATVDTFKSGDPQREVTGIAVSWMSTTKALKQALELGCNLFITHEPTYFDHNDADVAVFRYPQVKEKRRWIEESGIVILRCHDLWDQLPEEGIADTWAEWLNLGKPVSGEGYYRILDVSGRTAVEVAKAVASRIEVFGQEAVEFSGLPDQPVSRLATGTGAVTYFSDFIDRYHADIALCSDDGFVYWRDGALAEELGIPVIVVNHAVSEEVGMVSLARRLQYRFPSIPIFHIPHRCMYQLVDPK